MFDAKGLDAGRLLTTSPDAARQGARPADGHAFLAAVLPHLGKECAAGRVVVVETTVLDATCGEPAATHVRTALDHGAHTVTANKGPRAFAYRDLSVRAGRAGRRFLFESAVMDGVPVFSLVADAMPAVRVTAFRGVVNTTCAFILSSMERGVPFATALADMQARGIAEADATLDVDGWDAAAKAATLANVLLDADVTPRDVIRTGIAHLTQNDVLGAVAAGQRVRLVASGRREGHAVDVRVEPLRLEAADPLAMLVVVENALSLTTDLLGELTVVQRTGSLTQTAYGLVADLARIARG
jgi:homoserine dehydrogenase